MLELCSFLALRFSRPQEHFAIHGHVRVVACDGSMQVPRSGGFQLQVSRAELEQYRADVRDGSFRIEMQQEIARVAVRGLRLDGHDAIVDSYDDRPAKNWDGRLDLTATLLDGCSLHVVDAISGADLDCIDVHVGRSSPFVLDGAYVFERSLASPLALHPSREEDEDWMTSLFGAHRYWFGAPGYAWQDLRSELLQRGDRTIELEHAGTLGLAMTNYHPTWRTYVEVAADERELSFEFKPGPRAWPLFDHLPPGPYTVRALHRGFDVPTTVVGESHVMIESGRTTWSWLTVVDGPPDPCDGPIPDACFPDRSGILARDH